MLLSKENRRWKRKKQYQYSRLPSFTSKSIPKI
jgi:hypothetical protein